MVIRNSLYERGISAWINIPTIVHKNNDQCQKTNARNKRKTKLENCYNQYSKAEKTAKKLKIPQEIINFAPEEKQATLRYELAS